ncbi:SDR family NAD(P)-dependent oxidoreductase [Micromonospora auratinigra]|uniref:3-oxoacyl-[acyl-carrier protein] reductase n=1 Tax=Micromonospora auratinigra TaxID=261654 RepID=A0A1A8ZG10_9ACTN|nr:SDR family NAD(P)-dependent oxidoreductase [Micromonospora auratinigra]SBT42749.1 3-oxoacyl-[acyl-carrier protein] reductase [Micromonospora auratinigra]
MQLGLADRNVLVTGATGGIGQVVARVFAAEGARVAVTYRNDAEAAEKLAAELGAADDRALAVRYALDEPASVEAAVATVTERWGGVDVLVANAIRWGVRRSPDTRFEQVDPDVWQPVISDNLAPTIRTVQLVVPGMRERGWGRVVLVSSHIAVDGGKGQEFYGATKAGLHGFARSLAWDAGPDGVLVNVVAPGLTLTRRALTGLPEAVRERETKLTPTGRLSAPEDVANTIVYLCSDANGNVTGETVSVAGGR